MGLWVVEHCVGPLGLGTVVVKPLRHVIHLADLHSTEADQLGPVLVNVTRAVMMARTEVGETPEQVYACLWSHAERQPGHIHFVVQSVNAGVMAQHDAHGPKLQVRMFDADEPMDPVLMADAARRIRIHLDDRRPALNPDLARQRRPR